MWKLAFSLLKHCRRGRGVGGCVSGGGVGGGQKVASFPMFLRSNPSFRFVVANEFCVQPKTLINSDEDSKKDEHQGDNISLTEAKKIMRLVNVEALKTNLCAGGKDVIGYSELLQTCQSMGVARSPDEAASFVQSLDQAGVVLLFRDKVYLHPDKVVELVRKVVPLALNPEDDPGVNELKSLEEKKAEIDRLARRQVRYILSTGLGISVLQVGLFFRLTFWEFSWDVMEPIAFFTTATGIVAGYAYFLITSRDPTYEDFMKRLFLSRQRKLFKKHSFDVDRFTELKTKCKSSLTAPASIKDLLQPERMVRLD